MTDSTARVPTTATTATAASPVRRAPTKRGLRVTTNGVVGSINVRLPVELAREVRMLAVEEDRALCALVEDALRAYVLAADAKSARRA